MNNYEKIDIGTLFVILNDNVSESSFLIRKRIIKMIINLINEQFDKIELIYFKSVIGLFLNKILDNSESLKIKAIIYEFFHEFLIAKFTQDNKIAKKIIDLFVEILKEKEDFILNVNAYNEHFKSLFKNVYF